MNRDERIAELLKPHVESDNGWTEADIKVIRCLMEDAYGYGKSDGIHWAQHDAELRRKIRERATNG